MHKRNTDRKRQHINLINNEIEELVHQIRALELTKKRLNWEIISEEAFLPRAENPQGDSGKPTRIRRYNDLAQIGSRVVVDSHHKSRKGLKGEVIGHRGTTQVIVRVDNTGEEFSVWKNNVTIIKAEK